MMDTSSFYSGGASVTNFLGESSFNTPPSLPTIRNGYTSTDRSQSGSPMYPYANPRPDDLFSMNQKLDRVLALVLEQKSAVAQQEKETSEMKEKLASVLSEVSHLKHDLQSTGATLKSRKRVPKDISASVRKLHEKWPTCDRFCANESYKSDHNQKVRELLIDQLTPKFGDTHSPGRIKKAVHRYYESRRRLFNDDQPSRREKALKTRMKSRKNSLRKQLYQRRKKFLKGEGEKEKWASITEDYMTEESEDETGSFFRQHRLNWRSDALTKLIRKTGVKSPKLALPSKASHGCRQRLPPSKYLLTHQHGQ